MVSLDAIRDKGHSVVPTEQVVIRAALRHLLHDKGGLPDEVYQIVMVYTPEQWRECQEHRVEYPVQRRSTIQKTRSLGGEGVQPTLGPQERRTSMPSLRALQEEEWESGARVFHTPVSSSTPREPNRNRTQVSMDQEDNTPGQEPSQGRLRVRHSGGDRQAMRSSLGDGLTPIPAEYMHDRAEEDEEE